MPTYWRAALLGPPFSILTYLAPESLPEAAWRPGLRVLVPVGNSLRAAVLTGEQASPEAGELAGVELKPLTWPLEREPLLDEADLALATELSRRNLAPVGQALATMLPQGLRSTPALRFELKTGPGAKPRRLTARDMLEKGRSPEVAELWTAWESGRLRVVDRAERPEPTLKLAVDPPWPVRPSAARQIAVLDRLYESGPATRRGLLAALGPESAQALGRLLAAGTVIEGLPESAESAEQRETPTPTLPARFELTEDQRAAVETLAADLAKSGGGGATRLLFGVTGSGKTAVYLELAAKALAVGKSVLLLAPEVALAHALYQAAAARFPDRTQLRHGYQSPALRERALRRVVEAGERGEPLVVVGTRSALLLPVRRLGLIVLDEEHDAAYKQDERFPYQAKEIAWFKARRAQALLVLGSATPDVKSWRAAQGELGPPVIMARRVAGRPMPTARLIAMDPKFGIRPNAAPKKETESDDAPPPEIAAFAPETERAILETVAKGDQVAVMLNRRGYAPLMYCRECREVARCPECEVGLTYHKPRERLICHYCGHSRPFPSLCGKCGSSNYLAMGWGSQRLEEQLARLLPDGAGLLRLDRDSARRQERLEAILSDFAAGKAQVLVGTQMLSKGHNFPGVTLVVVADGDLGFNLPDYRARERTFQLLTQVAGRAGRGEKPGEVIVQTRNPEHPFWNLALSGDYRAFYEQEIALRQRYLYPPFTRLGLIRLSHPLDDERGAARMARAADLLRAAAKAHEVRLLGPAPAPMPLLRGRRRYQCLVKSTNWEGVRAVFSAVKEQASAGDELLRGLDVRLDLDPVDML